MESQNKKPFVSVIIPTWGEKGVLQRCLESLFNQDYPKNSYEIILVSLKKLGLKDERIKNIYNVDYANSRNAGAQASSGEIFAFLDDDCIAPETWISRAINYFNDEKVAIVGGSALPFENDDLPYRIGGYLLGSPFSAGFAISRYKKMPRMYDAKEYSLLTANNFIRKTAFEGISGFDVNQVPSEENDLYFRIKKAGYKMLYVPEIFVWHRAKPVFRPLMSKIFFYSSGRGILLARKPQTMKLIYFIPSLFVLGLLFLSLLSIFFKEFIYPLAILVFVYFSFSLANAFYIFFKSEKNLSVFMYSIIASFLMHVAYGIGILWGMLGNFFGFHRGALKAKNKF